MTRINQVNLQQVDNETRATLEGVKAKIGMIPNLYATFAQSPAALNGFLGFGEALSKGRLTAGQREIIALAVGQTNQCQYCISAHTAVGKSVGLSDQQISEARKSNSNDELAALAANIVEKRGVLDEADVENARAAGFDDGLLIEIIANVALNILTNYTNHIAGTEIDFPRVELAA